MVKQRTPPLPGQQEAQIRQQLHTLLQDQHPQFIHVIQGWLQQEKNQPGEQVSKRGKTAK
ncbi:MAG: hypothetical protein KAY06_09910 [Aeromonadaceae bacterium]|nr:hypothetical protein [Aeromonadaceae bacterium]